MRILGLISGTSQDGIDVAIVDFDLVGDELVTRIDHTTSVSYSTELRTLLTETATATGPTAFAQVCRVDTLVGQEFAAAAASAVELSGPVDLVCTHGQTVHHWVDDGTARGTLQLGQPAWIAEATNAAVVSDIRAADIAVGGQGAPLVPLLDHLLLQPHTAAGHKVAAANIGGIANLTICAPGAPPIAWDTGPGNALVDEAVSTATQTTDRYDRDGALAAAGRIDPDLVELYLTDPYYALAPPKSTGKEYFHLAALPAPPRDAAALSLEDRVATLTELTAVTLAEAVRAADAETVFASGGGVHNQTMMARLAAHLPETEVTTSAALGIPPDDKEAIAFALIGWASAHGLPGNMPSCTGARAPRVLGRISPAPSGRLPSVPSLTSLPRRMRITA